MKTETPDYATMEAGPIIDILIAKEVMDYDWCSPDYHPSWDIREAMRVVAKMKSLGWSFGCWDVPPVSSLMQGPAACFKFGVVPPNRSEQPGPNVAYASAGTFRLALCRAALLAIARNGGAA